ncbi:MAG: UTP--glucose-1-phosphate uridylyltransferase [SAR202 cluster bacterium]|nr:UTP--glucose-1-phosphate uridylyltransferase [SAR202 cluster bacterium]|tara:strand:+ start:2433 stop:3299 length:867 start_codon:yes stop_codon:yes gene_type:complete
MQDFPRITKAVIPVGGLGVRFLPATRTIPKPLLPILNVPVIEYAVREAADAGITDIAIVMSHGMEAVVDYFQRQPQLEEQLKQRGQYELLTRQIELASLANITTIYQDEPKGPGHAILQAREFCEGESFLVIFPDDVIINHPSATQQLIEVYKERGGTVIGVNRASEEVIPTKGIISGDPVSENVHMVEALIEKPALEDAPSNLAIVARYVLDNGVFNHLATENPGANNEIQITDAIAALIGISPVHAATLIGFHADTGNPKGMLEAAVHLAKQDPGFSNVVNELLNS